MKRELKEKISAIFAEHQDKLISLSKENPKWNIRGEWWNIKYYANQGTDDMTIPHQIAGSSEREIPVNPTLFFKRKGSRRFNLQGRSVGYFSSDASIAMCETVSALRYNPQPSVGRGTKRLFIRPNGFRQQYLRNATTV